MRRVVVTGMGVVCATGHDLAAFTNGLRDGRSGVDLIERFDTSWFHSQVAAEIRDYSFDHLMPPPEQRHIDRCSLLALAAAEEAAAQSGFDSAADTYRCGCIIGTGMGPSESTAEAIGEVLVQERKPRPTTIPKMMDNAVTGHVSIRFGLRGPSQTIITACSSSAHAVGQAAAFIRAGTVDAVVAGGSESLPARELWACWDTMRVMSRRNDEPTSASRPFDKDRDGFVMGEAAAMLVLESEERARARGAQILGEVAGVGLSSDAYHLTRPQVEGFVSAMRFALADAGLTPEQIAYVNAHGTATPTNDPLETAALKEVFGEHAGRLAISSTKSGHGHTIGAAGALEAVATLAAMNAGFVPPTLHLAEPSPDCDLDYVPNTARELAYDAALSNSFAFGGHNVSLVLRRYHG